MIRINISKHWLLVILSFMYFSNINAQDAISYYMQLTAEPFLAGCNYVGFRKGENENHNISCSYQASIYFMIRVPRKFLPTSGDSISIPIIFTLGPKNFDTNLQNLPPPSLSLPGFSPNRFFYSNTTGGGQDDNFITFSKGNLSMHRDYAFNISSNSNFDHEVKSFNQAITLDLTGTVSPDIPSSDTGFVYISGGGSMVLVLEVIDPIYRVCATVGKIKFGKHQYGQGHTNLHREVYIGGNMGRLKEKKLYCIARTQNSGYVEMQPISKHAELSSMAFRTFSDTSKLQYDTTIVHEGFALTDTLKSKLYWNSEDTTLVLKHPLSNSSPNFGWVSVKALPGLVPLYKAEKKAGVPNLPNERYSLCLLDLIHDPNYDNYSILCWVIPPDELQSPCPR